MTTSYNVLDWERALFSCTSNLEQRPFLDRLHHSLQFLGQVKI